MGAQLTRLSPAYAAPARAAVATAVVELVRSLVVTVAVAVLAARLELDSLAQALLLGTAR